MVSLLCLFAFCLVIVGCGDKANMITSMDPRTNIIRDGHFNDYPNIKIGDAYNKFFSSPQWKYFKSDDGTEVVEFSGGCQFRNADVNVRQQFILHTDDTFEAGALSINEVPQLQLISSALISTIFASYENKQLPTDFKKSIDKNENAGGNQAEDIRIKKVQALLDNAGIDARVQATSEGNNMNGSISLATMNGNKGFIVCNYNSSQIAWVLFDLKTYHFYEQKSTYGSGYDPLMFKLMIFNDTRGKDQNAGVWEENHHILPVYALFEVKNGQVVPGMLSTGEKTLAPKHYHSYLHEDKNVNTINLFLTEMKSLHNDIEIRGISL